MAIDIGKLKGSRGTPAVINPRDIFRTLQKGDPKKYQFPRDVQTEIWNGWFNNRDHRDQIIKANTGGGKTVVGLVLLQSSVNEGFGPAVYLCPSNQLVDQVLSEASGLGIKTTQDPRDAAYLRGRAVLVTNVHTLFNGRSKFGVDREAIPIGTLVFDDAHACLQTIEDQFTLVVPREHSIYSSIENALINGIKQQAEHKAFEIKEAYPGTIAEVPFWVWRDKLDEVRGHLAELRTDEEAQFTWPLVKGDLENCRCVFSAKGIEISTRVTPLDAIPSYKGAKRRIFMSATFADDSTLVTQLGIDATALKRQIVPDAANDVGDRLILVPQAINSGISDEEIKKYLEKKAKTQNVVVITPSTPRAGFWNSVADKTLDRESFAEGVQQLRRGHVGLVVFVNRYDGIDLPDDACRILVLDGLPDVRRSVEKVDESALYRSQVPRANATHRIEQGMGRATRSAEDYAAIILMGSGLVQQVMTANIRTDFTSITAAQIELSEQLSEQIEGGGLQAVDEAIELCLSRDKNWVQISRQGLVGLKYRDQSDVDPVALCRRKTFDEFRNLPSPTVVEGLIAVAEGLSDDERKGYVLAEAAALMDSLDRQRSQKLLLKAKKLNRGVFKPMAGIDYVKISIGTQRQANRCHKFLNETYLKPNDFVINMKAILDKLVFKPDTSEVFEEAFHQLGEHLGFPSQRPERDYNAGPDNLWGLGPLKYAVIEAKNGVTTESIKKGDCDQLGGSYRWFTAAYGTDCEAIPVIIHLSSRSAPDGTPPENGRGINLEQLSKLVEKVHRFTEAIASLPGFGTVKDIAEQLNAHSLNGHEIIMKHSTPLK